MALHIANFIVAQEVPMTLRSNCLAIAKVIITLQICMHMHIHII